MPKISVIVPVYNAEKYLGWCVNSILNQTFRDFELLLVNDGSTDGSLEICNNYAALDSRVRVITKENGGVSSARNQGLQEARGEYIQFVDSDDCIQPQMMEVLLETMSTYSADIVFCGIKIVKIESGVPHPVVDLTSDCLGKECVYDKKLFWENMMCFFWETSIMEGPCNRLYRLRIIQDKALRFPEDMSYGEDCVFNLGYYNHVNTAVFLREPYYYYIWHENESLARSYKNGLFSNQMRQVEMLLDYVKHNDALTKEGEFYWANYCASQTMKSLESLTSADCPLTKKEKKQVIVQVVHNQYVRDSFPEATYIPDRYDSMKQLVRECDVGGILEFLYDLKKGKSFKQNPTPHPGNLNIFLVSVCRGFQRIFQKGPINKWAHIVELNLATVGVKTTLIRAKNKLLK
nr:glycosyltransferase family 2 protein [Ruthenibacterium lactatiformans]